MYQDMTHPFNITPINLGMFCTIFQCQLIDCLTDDFYMFYQSEIYHRVRLGFIQCVMVLVVNKDIHSL